MSRGENAVLGFSCGGCLLVMVGVIVLNLTLGAYCAQYVLETWLPYVMHHPVHIPLLYALVIGLFGGEVTIPAALITWIIMLCV